MNVDLTPFVLARIAEDVDVATVAIDGYGTPKWANSDDEYVYPDPPPGNSYIAVGPWDGGIGLPARHIARHDPARVLAQCAAMRKVVDLHDRAHHQCVADDEDGPSTLWRTSANPCDTLRALASIWSDHPDYRQEWR